MDQHTYTDPIKADSREKLWAHAIGALTRDRKSARLLRRDKYESGWDYCASTLSRYTGQRLAKEQLVDWLAFVDSRYGQRNASELRVAYLCGPEPENDLRVLVQHGVRIENVWAIEENARAHDAALQGARAAFPSLKVYHGGFDSFVRVVRDRFDIVYLDFTAPLVSPKARPYSTIHAVFDEQVLADFGVLVINVAEPANSSDVTELLAAYFAQQPYIESHALGYSDEEDPAAIWYAETTPDQWRSHAALAGAICSDLPEFYSAFCTQYPSLYANRVQPALRILRVAEARRSLYTKDTNLYDRASRAASDGSAMVAMIRDGSLPNCAEGFGPGLDFLMSPSEFPLWWFIESIRGKKGSNKIACKWLAEYEEKLSPLDSHPYKATRTDAVRLSDLLWLIEEGYYPLASGVLLDAMVGSLRAFAGRKAGLFCDIPMFHLLSQLSLNQLGFAHHPVQDQFWRAVYKAKRTRMYLDVHVFDQCRPMYDRLPAVALYPEHFRDLDQQFITRIGVSLVGAQAHGLVPKLYWASSLAGRCSPAWECWASLPQRTDLNSTMA